MNETSDDKRAPGLSRRDFIKLLPVGVAAGVAVGGGLLEMANRIDLSSKEPLALTPEITAGVEVYGLKEKISSADTVDRLYSYLDDKFAESLDIRIGDKIKQRQELLSPNERYLEVVMRRSAYDSFVLKKAETGVDFAEWIKIHVDVMNRCLKKAKPPSKMKAVLRRILVIDDSMAKEFWDEDLYRQGGASGTALDVAWRNRFTDHYPLDTDQSWAIADDYRESGGGMFWELVHQDGKVIMGSPSGRTPFDQYFEFPEENDSLLGKNNVRFDMGLIHEWSHYLLTLPDEYAQDVHDSSHRFKHFLFGTSHLNQPEVSPYLSYLTQANINLKERGLTSRVHQSFYDRPNSIVINSRLNGFGQVHTEIRRVRLDGGLIGQKHVPKDPDEISGNLSIRLKDNLFIGNSNCWLLSLTNGQAVREVFLPAAAFNMSKISGLNSVRYDLVFSGYDDTTKTQQEVKLIDESDMNEFVKNEKEPYYAKMKVEGTNTWFVWFLRD